MKEYMDTPAPERYLTHLRELPIEVEANIAALFNGEQSQDFYLGMISGIKSYFNVLDTIPMPQSFKDGITHCSLDIQKVVIQHIK